MGYAHSPWPLEYVIENDVGCGGGDDARAFCACAATMGQGDGAESSRKSETSEASAVSE